MEQKNIIKITANNFLKVFFKNPLLIFHSNNLVDWIKQSAYFGKYNVSIDDYLSNIKFGNIDELDDDEDESSENAIDANKVSEFMSEQSLQMELDTNSDKLVWSNNFLHELDSIFAKQENSEQVEFIKVNISEFLQFKLDAYNWYLNKHNYKPNEVGYIKQIDNLEVKLQQTLNYLNDDKIKVIIEPVFAYKIENQNDVFYLTSSALIYDKQLKKYVGLSYVDKAKKDLYQKNFYNYNVLNKANIPLESISEIIINPFVNKLRLTQKDKIDFYEVFSAMTKIKSPSKPSNKSDKLDWMSEDDFYNLFTPIEHGLLKSGTLALYDSWNEQDYLNNFTKNSNSFILSAKRGYYCDRSLGLNLEEFVAIPNAIKTFSEFIDQIKETHDIYKSVNSLIEKSNGVFLTKDKRGSSPESYVYYEQFDSYIDKIINSYYLAPELSNIDYNLFRYCFSKDAEDNFELMNNLNDYINAYKNSQISNSSLINIPTDVFKSPDKLVIRAYLYGKDFIPYSFGRIVKESEDKVHELINKYEKINAINVKAALDKIFKIHLKDSVIVWYDYEGFSSIYPVIPGTSSYQQIVNQVSVIKTQNGKEIYKENFVIDTKNFDLSKIIYMFKIIHDKDAKGYVVYNKTYENTRNKELLNLIEVEYKNNNEKIQEQIHLHFETLGNFKQVINEINNLAIDLNDIFKSTSTELKSRLSSDKYFIVFKENTSNETLELVKLINSDTERFTLDRICYINELLRFSSIKKVEKYITHNNLKLKTLITPYSELVIQKGTMAMEKAQIRHAKLIGDSHWENDIVPELKKYCENDVRAMIMVYELIMYILRLRFSELDEYEYKIDSERYEYKIENERITLAPRY
ncbi:UU173 family protein [Mycoplasma sp. 4404]|uniref:UU173 family protein n=1 Tax=Mycoplasma sp. 4404 TaxID=3108530 RepID=UPI002B1E57E1|nr:DUF2779 domain-containing protein [Mycoplasma sp. 4404]MEA4162472.1 DUF2779 domain-containing protein [Mycoplasma sp. 4404]